MQMYVEAQAKTDGKVQAGNSCHKESGFIQEIATEVDLFFFEPSELHLTLRSQQHSAPTTWIGHVAGRTRGEP